MRQKRFTKLMSMLLVMAILFTMMPAVAWADETVLPVSGGTIDLVDTQTGPYTIQKLDVYTQGDYAPVSITSATQNGNTINIVLSEGTSLTAALQAGLSGSGQGALQHSGNQCTLVNGSGTMNYSYTVKMGPQSVAGGSYTIHFTVPMGVSYDVLLPKGDGFTVSGNESAFEGSSYNFHVSVAEGYDGSNMIVKVNGSELEGNNGTYTVEDVNSDLDITVEGIVKKEICNITALEGDGFTFSGTETVYKGESYSFKIAVDSAYNGSGMVVKANDEVVEGSNGNYTIAAVNEDTVITVDGIVKKEICNITAPEGEGFTFTGAATVYKGEGYNFKIAVDTAYNGTAMVVKANGEVVEGTNGSYTIAVVNEDTEITVDGIVKKAIYTITAPEAGKFTFTGAETVYEGDDYNFTIKTNPGYNAIVKVNNEETVGTNGTYKAAAVSENLIITVEIQRVSLPETELLVKDNIIDITDKTIHSYFSDRYYAKTTNISIGGVSVAEAYEDGSTVYIILPHETADDASVSVTFGTAVNSYTVSGHTGTLILEDGEGSLTMTVKGEYSRTKYGTAQYTLIFFREAAPTEPPVCVKKADTAEVWKDRALEIDLDKYFTGAETYYLVEGENKTPIDAVYSFTSNQAGELVLTFAASNLIGDCQDQLTITVKVKEIENGVYIGHATSNGSLDYVTFTDGEGNPIEGLNAVYANKIITVSLPKTYPLDGKVTATFVRKANSSGLPFLSASNAFNQGTGSRTDVFTNTLNNGAAARTAYLYNSEPKATSNSPETFTINYAIVNELPVLAEGQAAATEATVTAGQPFTFKLGEIFTDADGDDMTYLVSANGGTAAAAEVDEDGYYSFVTNEAGVYTLVFTANDGKGTSAATYTVNLTVENSSETKKMTVSVPDNLEPKFYVSSGYGTDGKDILGEEITAVKGADAVYTLDYPKNASMISVRTDNYGGMAFKAEEGTHIVLRCAEMSVVDYDNKAAVSTNTVTYDGHTAPAGTDGWMLVVGGSYTYTAVPENAADFKTAAKTETLAEGTEPYAVELMLGMNNAITITTTTGAAARLYNYDINKYYYATEIVPKIVENHDNGTTTYYFSANGQCLIYHVSTPGKITKAGYLGYNQKSVNAVYTENDKAADYRLDNYSVTGEDNSSITEDSVLLNINAQNNLSMSVGASKTLKAYRAWEIIKLSYQNYIITPNFHYDILKGEDVISLAEKDSPSAGEGDWKMLTALKEGTAIIEVSYDALELAKDPVIGGTSYSGTYGASDPARTGLAVIQVGGHDSSVKFGIESKASKGSLTYSASNARTWDAEFDTLYFTGESGNLKLAPTADSKITEVAVSNDKGESWTVLTAEEGKYTANIVSGNNIIRVTTEAGAAYQVVRGDKVNVSVTEVSDASDNDGLIEAGEKVRVTFDGLHQPIPKMAGNYNPGYRGNYDGDGGVHLKYQFNGTSVEGERTQYNFITATNYVEVTIPAENTASSYTLSDGYISVGVIGLTQFSDGGDSHRNIPDSGCGTRQNETTFHTRSMLPEITITVGGAAAENNPPAVLPGSVTEASIEAGKYYPVPLGTIFTDKDGDTLTYTVSVNGGEAKAVEADYKYYAETEGTYILKFTAADGKENSNAAEHTITLTVTKKEEKPDVPSGPKFDLAESQIKGYATVSFEDFAERIEDEKGLKYPTPLGIIVPATSVPYAEGDTIADVTLRLLDALGIGASYSGSTKSGFYLGAITNFEVDNTPYSSMGEFDVGSGSGWMITHNGKFIEQGASQFQVKNGDVIQWQYTCQLGKDIGDPFYDEKDEAVENVTTTTGTSGDAGEAGQTITTTPTEVTVSGSTATATITKENVAETIKQATENKSAEIVVQVLAEDTEAAETVKVQLDTATVKDIVNKTEAALTVKTAMGTMTFDRETLARIAADAKGSTVTVDFTKGEGEQVQVTVTSGSDVLYTGEIGPSLGQKELSADEVKALLADLTPVARSVKTPNKNTKVTLKLDSADKAIIEELEAAGYTVKYNFYRSTKKSSKYESMLIKEGKTYTNTIGKKDKMYFYKVRVQVYDAEGKLIARTALKDCWYANRKWTK